MVGRRSIIWNVQVGAARRARSGRGFWGAHAGQSAAAPRGAGEGDEMSVMRTLWDFENNANVENYARGRGRRITRIMADAD